MDRAEYLAAAAPATTAPTPMTTTTATTTAPVTARPSTATPAPGKGPRPPRRWASAEVRAQLAELLAAQRSATDDEPDPTPLVDRAMAGAAIPLPHRSALEAGFGMDLGHLRAHGGAGARAALQELGAEAAQRGLDVAFADAAPSLEVVAHEVAHVVQNPRGGERIAAEDARAEVEADAVAVAVAGGTHGGDAARALTPSPAGVHLMRLRRTGKKGRWRCVDSKDRSTDPKHPDVNPANLDDQGLFDLITELLRLGDYGLLIRVMNAVGDGKLRRLRSLPSGHDDVGEVIQLYLSTTVEVDGDDDHLIVIRPELEWEDWRRTFVENAHAIFEGTPPLMSESALRELYAADPTVNGAWRAACGTSTAAGILEGMEGLLSCTLDADAASRFQTLWAQIAPLRRRCLTSAAALLLAADVFRTLLAVMIEEGWPISAELVEEIQAGREDNVPRELFCGIHRELTATPRATGNRLVQQHGGSAHIAEPLFVVCNAACDRLLGGEGAQQAAGPGTYGFVANVPTIANGKDRPPLEIARAYLAEAAPGDGHSLALVIGVNERLPGSAQEREQRSTAMLALASQIYAFAELPVIVVGFFWQSDLPDQPKERDRSPAPYGLIRNFLKDHPLTRECVAALRARHGDERTYLHVGDSDPMTLQVDGRNLFARHAAFLGDQPQGRAPEVVGGAYGFHLDPTQRAARAIHSLPEEYAMCSSMLLRDVGASINPLFPYYAEANLLIKASDRNLATSFETTKVESQAYLNNLQTKLQAAEPDGDPWALHRHFAFDFDLRVVTDASRQAASFRDRWGDLVSKVVRALAAPRNAGARLRLRRKLGLPTTCCTKALGFMLLQHPELLVTTAVELGCVTEVDLLESQIRMVHSVLKQCTAHSRQYNQRLISCFHLNHDESAFTSGMAELLFAHRAASYRPYELGVILALSPEDVLDYGPHTLNKFAYCIFANVAGHVVAELDLDTGELPDQKPQTLPPPLSELLLAGEAATCVNTAKLAAAAATIEASATAATLPEEELASVTSLVSRLREAAPAGIAATKAYLGALRTAAETIALRLATLSAPPDAGAAAALRQLRKGLASLRAALVRAQTKNRTLERSPVVTRGAAVALLLLRELDAAGADASQRRFVLELVAGATSAAHQLVTLRSGKRPDHADELLWLLDAVSLVKNTACLHDTMMVGFLEGVGDPMAHVESTRRRLKTIAAMRRCLLEFVLGRAKARPEEAASLKRSCFQIILGQIELLAYCETPDSARLLCARVWKAIGHLRDDFALHSPEDKDAFALLTVAMAAHRDSLLAILGGEAEAQEEEGDGEAAAAAASAVGSAPRSRKGKERQRVTAYEEPEQKAKESAVNEKKRKRQSRSPAPDEAWEIEVAVRRSLRDLTGDGDAGSASGHAGDRDDGAGSGEAMQWSEYPDEAMHCSDDEGEGDAPPGRGD